MTAFKRNSIKFLFALLFSVIALLCVWMPISLARADASPEFTLVHGASLRYPEEPDTVIGGEEMRYKGIRFTTRVNTAWFTANESSEYYFGTLVFPAKHGNVNPGLSVDANEENLEAIEFKADLSKIREKGYYTAAIVFDYNTVKELSISAGLVDRNDASIDEKIDAILNKLYSMQLTAVSYVETEDEVIYTDSYTTSMTEVAVKLIKDPEWTEKLSEYVTLKSPVTNGYVTVADGVIGNFDGTGAVSVFKGSDEIDFTLSDGKITLPSSFTDGKLGTEEVLSVLDENNNLTDVTVYYTDVAISTAEEFYQIFNLGDYSASTAYPIENGAHYALMNDIDLRDYLFHNTCDADNIALTGTLDGRGHVVSNATVDMTKASNKATQGLLGKISGTVKNIAFVNLKGTAGAGTDVGLTAPLSRYLSGTLENVYIDVSSDHYNSRGPIATYATSATMTNVVINFPQADGFVFDDAMYQTVASSTSTYAYGYGSLGYAINNLKNLTNVYVISPMPINYACGAGGSSKVDTTSLTSDYFTYGENETDVWYNFTYFKNNGITEPTVENTKGARGSSKTVVLDGLRRYDSFTDMVADSSSKNTENIQTLLSTGLWLMEGGNLKWHNHTINITYTNEVDYDADTGTLLTTAFNTSDIVKVTVQGEELTLANGGLVESGDGYAIRAKTSASDAVAGVPYMDNYVTADRHFALTVYTSEGTYSFDNVLYNTMIINDAVELKSALDITYTKDPTNNYGFFKLGNDVNMAGVSFNYTGASTYLPHALKDSGFAGQFDGDGYSLKNVDSLGRYGLFGALNHGGGTAVTKGKVIVENLAIINFTSPNNATYGTPVLAQSTKTHTYGEGVLIKNVYVKYGVGAIANGLILEPGILTMENVLVDASDTAQYDYAQASDGYFVSGDGVIDAWRTSNSSDGGSIFSRFRRLTSTIFPNLNNVISVGLNPIALQNLIGEYTWYSKLAKHTADGDGTYTHTVKNTGWGGSPITSEVYIGYAGNRSTGDIPVPTGFKSGFLSLVDAVAGTAAYPGYACLGCGETFSTSAGDCSCGAKLTYFSDLWSAPVSYIWTLPDIATYENPASSSSNGAFVFSGVDKYDTSGDMANAYKKDGSVYSTFLGEEGNELWGVNSAGELVWKNLVGSDVSVKADGNAISGAVELKIGEYSSIEIWNGETQIEVTSLTSSSDAVSIVSDVVFAEKQGSAVLTITYVIDGVSFIKKITVNVDHDYGELIVGTPSTCTQNGTVSYYECSCCGKYFDTAHNEIDDINVIGSHAYGEWICGGDGTHYKVCAKDNTHVIREACSGGNATCTEQAVCTTCNGAYGEANGHTGGTATCTSAPVCTVCGESYGEANGHTFTKKAVNSFYLKTSATCLNSAVYYYACTDCSAKSSETYENGNPLGHTGGTATCTSGPLCTRCGVEYGEPNGHDFTLKAVSDYYLKTGATCLDSAVYYYACHNCNEISGESYVYGDPLGHTGGEATCENGPICTRCGTEYGEGFGHNYVYGYNDSNHWLRCTVCKHDSVYGEHDHSENLVSKEPTCTEEGELADACVCGHKITQKIAKLSHVFGVYVDETPATCLTTGIAGHYVCQTCNGYFDKYGASLDTIVLPLAHTFKTYNQPIAPTCSQTGSKGFYQCEDCDKYFTFNMEEITYDDILVPATGHLESSSGRCACGEVYFDLFTGIVFDENNSQRAYNEHFEFIKIGHIYPGQNTYKWGWALNRFYGSADNAPTHIKVPSQFYVEATDTYYDILSIGRFVFDVSGSVDSYNNASTDGSNTSPTDGNPENVAIESIVISEGIEFIGSSAFSGSRIEEIVIPNSVIGGYGSKVRSDYTHGANENYNYLNYEWQIRNICSGCTQLKRVTIGSRIDVLGGYCFYGCSLIEDITFVVERDENGVAIDGVEEIHQRAFGQNSGFTIDPTQPESKAGRIVLPETLISIPESSIYATAVDKTVRLYKLFSPDPIYFLNITKEELQARTVPALLRDASGELIYDENGNTLGVDGSIMTGRIGYTDGWSGNATIYYKGEWYYDDDGCPRAYAENETVDIDYDFADTTFKMLNDGTLVGLTDYGKTLTEITVPSAINGVSVVKIGSNAFKGASVLTTITLPSTVATIADYGFAEVSSLVTVNVTSNVTRVGKDVFRKSVSVSTLNVNSQNANVSSVTIAGTNKIAEICNGLGAFTMEISGSNYVVTTANTVYTLDANGFAYTDDNVLVAYLGTATNVEIYDFIVEIGDGAFENKDIASVSIPSSVTKIGANAFRGTSIRTVELPENLTEIGKGAFSQTALTSITIPNGVKVIPERAFENCYLLGSVEWGEGLTEIGYGAFMNCYSLFEVILPSGVEIIGDHAFFEARSVRTVSLPVSVKYIGEYAFANLISAYKLDYAGTVSKWHEIDLKSTWNFGSNDLDVRCVDGAGDYLDVEESVDIAIGQKYALSYNIPSVLGVLQWYSSDKSVVTVDNYGRITGVELGTAQITVTNGYGTGICNVTVGYGDYLPKLEFVNSIQDGDCLDVGKAYSLRPRVTFNGVKFSDFTVVYEVTDSSVATVANGALRTLKTGSVQVTAKATWRSFSADSWYGLEQTFTVNVIGTVEFKVNGGLPIAQSVLAPTAFSQGENELMFVPTVVVDGTEEYTPSVSLDYLDGAGAENLVYDSANNKFIGYKLGKAEITLSYTVFGLKFQAKFPFEVLPNEVTVNEEVYFSAEDGYAFVKQGDVYVQTTMGEYLGGVTVNSANSQGGEMFVDGDGALLGVAYSTVGERSTTMNVYTDTAVYRVSIIVVQRIIDTPEDLIEALQLSGSVKNGLTEIYGYFMLANNVDMAGYALYNSTLTQGDARFCGTFEGNGFAVQNASIDMYRGTGNKNISQGIFGTIYEGAIVRNVAFTNLKGYTSQEVADVGLQAPLAYSLSGKIENVYVHVSPENFNNRGPIASYSSKAVISNFVVYYECEEDFVFNEDKYFEVATGKTGKHAWGYGSLGSSVSNLAQATVENVYVISPMPVQISTGGGGDNYLNTETYALNITYGENETEVFVNYDYWATLATPILEPTVQNTLGQKTSVLAGVRRYDDFAKLASDDTAENLSYTQALIDTGLWSLNASGELVWNSL